MKKKFLILSLCSFVLSVFILVFSYFVYHYLTPEGFSAIWHAQAQKPFVTELLANLGVLFFFSSIMSLLIAIIFSDRK